MNKFDKFTRDLDGVTSARELCGIICELGLKRDHRGIYGEHHAHQVDVGGAWQDPLELATFLWECRDVFRGVRSYLDIGTCNGYTFFIIMSFLRRFVDPDIRCKTIDPEWHMDDPSISPYIMPYYERCTSDDIAARGETYDLVFIDGCHEGEWPMRDYNNVSGFASVVFFHDVVDKWCPAVRSAFSALEADGLSTRRYVLSHDGSTFGIGVVVLKPEPL